MKSRSQTRWLMALFDGLELVFGPDPGLLRLRVATRAVISAALALTVLLLSTRGAGHSAVAAIALGFMTANLSNVLVRDKGRQRQALTLALLALPAFGAATLASWLSNWPWLGEIGFIGVVVGATLARRFGQRGIALGMVAFICYFIGEIMRPSIHDLPLLAGGVAAGLGASALMRFVVLPDDPRATLRHLVWHLRRRVTRVLTEAASALKNGSDSAARQRRMHRELVRLNGTFVAGSEQVDLLGEELDADAVRSRLLAVELAAERVLRSVSREPAEKRPADAERLSALADHLREGRLPRHRDGPRPEQAGERYRGAPVGAALDALENALADLACV